MSLPTKYIAVVPRNWFWRSLRFLLPKMVAVKFMVRGTPSITMFDINTLYKVRFRHPEFAYWFYHIWFKIKPHNGKGIGGE
jgi:hypothetical protein